MNICFTIDKSGVFQLHMTFKRFNDSKRLLDRSQYFKILEGEKLTGVLPKPWKKCFNNGIIIPVKMIRCGECECEVLCMASNNQANEKRKSPDQFGFMHPFFKD